MSKVCVALAWAICVVGALFGREEMISLPIQIGYAAALIYAAAFTAVVVATEN